MKRLLLLLLLVGCSRAPTPTPTYQRPVCTFRHVDRHNVIITLDAGHGGKDPGALSANKQYQEKNLALATTLMVRDHLKAMGYQIHLTRTNDTFVPLTDRSKLANENKSDLFVSIHYNHSDSPTARGVEVFTFKTDVTGNRETEAKKLASTVLSQVIECTSAPSRGVKEANFSVLRRTQMPAILVEGGFLSNEIELRYLQDPRYLNSVAWGIANGIDKYVSQK
ncbi:MAG: N-acetylmuramoyl-L-alanine amidase [Parachlamydiales bacterium]